MERASRSDYYLGIAAVVSWRACCTGAKVGAIAVKNDHILATGYNGTPRRWPNCGDEGSCPRCEVRESDSKFSSSSNLDICVCVHAEANAIATAARFGVPLDGSVFYVTHQPCLDCAKELIQVGVEEVHYLKSFSMKNEDEGLQDQVRRTHLRLMGALNAQMHDSQSIAHGVISWLQKQILVPALPVKRRD